jgi:hypothetical protein
MRVYPSVSPIHNGVTSSYTVIGTVEWNDWYAKKEEHTVKLTKGLNPSTTFSSERSMCVCSNVIGSNNRTFLKTSLVF